MIEIPFNFLIYRTKFQWHIKKELNNDLNSSDVPSVGELYNVAQIMKSARNTKPFNALFKLFINQKLPVQIYRSGFQDKELFKIFPAFLEANKYNYEILYISIKLILIHLSIVYNDFFILDFKTGVQFRKLLECIIVQRYLEPFLYLPRTATFVPFEFLFNDNDDEIFFVHQAGSLFFIIYIKSNYASNEIVKECLDEVMTYFKRLDKEARFKFVLMDTVKAIRNEEHTELKNIIESKNVEFIPMSIQSLGCLYKNWIDLFLQIECYLNGETYTNTNEAEKEKIIELSQLPSLRAYCKLCENVEIQKLSDGNFYCINHGLFDKKLFNTLCDVMCSENNSGNGNQVIIRSYNCSRYLCVEKDCKKLVCLHAISEQELKIWKYLKYFDEELVNICQFAESNVGLIKKNQVFNAFENIKSFIRENKQVEYIRYFNRFEGESFPFSRFVITDETEINENFSLKAFVEEAAKCNNFGFIKYIFNKYLNEPEFELVNNSDCFEIVKFLAKHVNEDCKLYYEEFYNTFKDEIESSPDSYLSKYNECLKSYLDIEDVSELDDFEKRYFDCF